MNIHGNADSHVDALCHVIFDGKLYNGVSADTITATGAAQLSIGLAARRHRWPRGAAGRAAFRGVSWLEPGDHVTVADVLAAEQDQQVQIGQGDIVLVRVGHRRRAHRAGSMGCRRGAGRAAPRRAAATGRAPGRRPGQRRQQRHCPSAVAGVDFPVHVLTVNALGLHLLDYLQFTELRQVCAEIRRWSFLCHDRAAAGCRAGTGSPVNPIAYCDAPWGTSGRLSSRHHRTAGQARPHSPGRMMQHSGMATAGY